MWALLMLIGIAGASLIPASGLHGIPGASWGGAMGLLAAVGAIGMARPRKPKQTKP